MTYFLLSYILPVNSSCVRHRQFGTFLSLGTPQQQLFGSFVLPSRSPRLVLLIHTVVGNTGLRRPWLLRAAVNSCRPPRCPRYCRGTPPSRSPTGLSVFLIRLGSGWCLSCYGVVDEGGGVHICMYQQTATCGEYDVAMKKSINFQIDFSHLPLPSSIFCGRWSRCSWVSRGNVGICGGLDVCSDP